MKNSCDGYKNGENKKGNSYINIVRNMLEDK